MVNACRQDREFHDDIIPFLHHRGQPDTFRKYLDPDLEHQVSDFRGQWTEAVGEFRIQGIQFLFFTDRCHAAVEFDAGLVIFNVIFGNPDVQRQLHGDGVEQVSHLPCNAEVLVRNFHALDITDVADRLCQHACIQMETD